jgi:hypothetical protein
VKQNVRRLYNTRGTTTEAAHSLELLVKKFFITILTF